MEEWTRKEKESQKMYPLFRALWNDITCKKLRYKYIETFFRDWPGDVGRRLRYLFWSGSFKKIGKKVIFWGGLRIKHPAKIELGENVQLGYCNHYQATSGIKIGDNTIIGPNVNIWTMNHVYSDMNVPIAEQGYEKKSVEIGDDCWVTSKCFILPGARIPNGCVVLPNSVVGVMKIEPYSIIGGTPAKVMGNRRLLGKFKKFSEVKKDG